MRKTRKAGDNLENKTREETSDAAVLYTNQSSPTTQHDSAPIYPPKTKYLGIQNVSCPYPLRKSDLLVCKVLLEGQVAERDIKDGSDFIQCHLYALCNLAHCCDFMTIMQKTREFMGQETSAKVGEQCSTENTTLQKNILPKCSDTLFNTTEY